MANDANSIVELSFTGRIRERPLRGNVMKRQPVLCTISSAVLMFSTHAFTQQVQFGTATEAKAMLERAVAAVKADKARAIEMFKNGGDGFKDRDLFPFCFNLSDGKFVAASPTSLGVDIRSRKDATGKAYGEELYIAAHEAKISEVTYMFARPGNDKTPVQKTSFVTRAGDLGCAVGYFN